MRANSRTAWAGILLLLPILPILASGCLNNSLRGGSRSGTGTPITTSDPAAGEPVTSASVINLSRVVKTASDPSASLDLIGDGSGSLGAFCTSSGSGSSQSGPSTCACTYAYTRPDGAPEQFDADTTYREDDLIRCPYTSLPASLAQVTVKIHLKSADAYSNDVTFKFTGTGVSTDLSDPESFAKVFRFQCRDTVVVSSQIMSASGGSMYDPVQSEDPQLTYPLDFYTTSLGTALLNFAVGPIASPEYWNCPPIMDPDRYLADRLPLQPDLTQYKTAEQQNLRIFSVGPDSSGNKMIYPPGGVFDRSTFFLSKSKVGVFNVAVDGFIGPGLPTSEANGASGAGPGSFGYGASPIPSGAGQESCPDTSVTIPAGYQWVKVWLFRADLPSRKSRSSDQVEKIRGLACAPGDFANPAPSAPATMPPRPILTCPATAGGNIVNNGANGQAQVALGSLATRALGSGGCVTISGVDATYSNANVPLTSPVSDRWTTPAAGAINQCSAGNPSIYLIYPSACPNGSTFSPIDDNVVLSDIDTLANGSARSDFLFVVTPPDVMAAQMQNSSNNASYPYTPYRYFSATDCNSTDPDAPSTPGDCSPGRIIHYGLKLHSVASAGDPPGDDPSRPGVFPVCALQPTGGP